VNTALLHSVIVQEKRGMLRKWNVMLVVTAFLLSIFGSFITRSGIISGVHSFAQSPVGNWFAAFLVISVAVTAYLVTTRLKDLEAKATLESPVSREAAFLYNNVVLVGIAFSVLWGTLFPIISEAVRGEKITVGPPFFNAVNIPLGLTLLLLTGIGPLIAWRRASLGNLRRQFAAPAFAGVVAAIILAGFGMRDFAATIAYTFAAFVAMAVIQEFYRGVAARRRMYSEGVVTAFGRLVARNRPRYGGYIVHMGFAIVFAAFAGLAFRKEFDVTLKPGDAKEVVDPFGHRWKFVSEGLSQYDLLNRQVTALALALSRDGKREAILTTEKRQHVDSRGAPTFEPSTEVGIRPSWRQDVYVVLAGVRDGETAEIRIAFNPLVRWLWLGGGLMALGGIVVMWPQAERRQVQSGYAVAMPPAHQPAAVSSADATQEEMNALNAAVRDDS
jgi:cytochrome c-type biogenesis protein CcmF